MPDNKYSLTVKWSDRDPHEEDFPVNNTVDKVRKDAGAAFDIQSKALEQYKVLWDKGNGLLQELDLAAKLKDVEGLGDGACLVLQAPATPLG